MAYEIQDRLSLKLMIAGVEFVFNRANNLNFLHMSASSKIGVPMIHLSLDDAVDFLADQALLGDGVPISVILSNNTSGSRPTTYNFRLHTFSKKNSSPGTQYEMDGYLDVPKYWLQSSIALKKGTSSQVLKKIAEDCGLTFDGAATNDLMIHYPANRKNHIWARDIAGTSWASDSQSMNLAIDFGKQMRFKDITDLADVNHRASFMEPKNGYIMVTDFKPASDSGMNNARHNYSSAIVRQYAGYNNMVSTIPIRPLGSEVSFSRNTTLGSSITRGNIQFAPIEFGDAYTGRKDGGNVHANYHKAKYSNARHNATFSQPCYIVTPEVTNVKIFDNLSLSFNAQDAASSLYQKMYSGTFKVVSRTVYVHANNYYEKLELVRRASPVRMKEN